jgi:hypothetical protein
MTRPTLRDIDLNAGKISHYRYVRHDAPTPAGWTDDGPCPGHHGNWSRMARLAEAQQETLAMTMYTSDVVFDGIRQKSPEESARHVKRALNALARAEVCRRGVEVHPRIAEHNETATLSKMEIDDMTPPDHTTATRANGHIDMEAVNRPAHYTQGGVEVIDIIEQITKDYPPAIAYHIGNILKYLARAPHKGAMQEDLAKANWYLTRAVNQSVKL